MITVVWKESRIFVKTRLLSLSKLSTWLSFHLHYRKKFDWIVPQKKSFSQCSALVYQKKVVFLSKPKWWHLKNNSFELWNEHISWIQMSKGDSRCRLLCFTFNESSKMRKTTKMIKFFELDVVWCYLVSLLNHLNQQKNGRLNF